MNLKLLVDENLPTAICDFIRQRRPYWTVFHVQEVGLCHTPDAEIFRWAQIENCLILTFDSDFADHTRFPLGSHAGIIRLRVHPPTKRQAMLALDRLFATLLDRDLAGSLVIIDSDKIRIRRRG